MWGFIEFSVRLLSPLYLPLLHSLYPFHFLSLSVLVITQAVSHAQVSVVYMCVCVVGCYCEMPEKGQIVISSQSNGAEGSHRRRQTHIIPPNHFNLFRERALCLRDREVQ